ncbi:hypothetical protein LMG29542_01439 [Paraburkholderia humisilvae]|uniref:Uncharacterized protein n=1 Tax=Paraburkholderia humisilvae TaxID=627669 RepID=A0A6J5DAA7_9BURK|nr:hypothetical protein LMG29542_01439 [Paraburkholderia humisilvae]
MDFVYIIGVAAFYGLIVALVLGCERLHKRVAGGRP